MDLFENAVFMLSCGRVKTELFENADVKASIYDVSEHAHGSLGTTKGHFDCLFSFVEVRTAKFECSSVFVWTGIFSKTLLVWTRIFLKTDKKRCVFKNIRIHVDGAIVLDPRFPIILRIPMLLALLFPIILRISYSNAVFYLQKNNKKLKVCLECQLGVNLD